MQENTKEDDPSNLYRLFRFKNETKTGVDYILDILKKAEQEKILDYFQRNMMEKSLMFSCITVSDIMTHRVDIKAVGRDSTIEELLNVCLSSGFSRIPIYEKDIDNIVGLIYVKDLLRLILEDGSRKRSIEPFIREISFVTESMNCVDLVRQLKNSHNHLSVVVDEYGGTSGIVSLEDAMEAVFGEIQDEYDNESDKIVKLDDNTFLFQGAADLEEISELLNINIEKNSNYDTLGGFLVDRLGSVPGKGETPTIVHEGVEFKILSVNKQHIEKVKAIKKLPEK